MKALRAVILIIGFLGAGEVWAQGFDEVLVTPHNLFPKAPESTVSDTCRVCHVEESEAIPRIRVTALELKEATPLWDSRNTTQVFLPLPQVQPPLGKGGPDHRPFGPSFHCLTCHDGALGNDVHQLGFTNGRGEARPAEMISARPGLRSPDHPDSILYPRKPTGELLGHRTDPNLDRYWSIPDRGEEGMVIPTGPQSLHLNLQNIDPRDPNHTAGLVRTFLGVIHCDTCHNPHSNQNRPFLRLPAQNLCLVCHQR